jgi:hypothetical protein
MSQMAKKARTSFSKEKAKAKAKGQAIQAIPTIPVIPDPSPPITHFLRPEKRFNILPTTATNHLISMYADIFPMNYTRRHYYIQKHFPMTSPFAGVQLYFNLPVDPISTGWSKEKSIAIRKALAYIMRHRFAFKKLLNHIRFKRLQKANEEDIVTGEVPKYPVHIVSWSEKRVYTFEAYTLMKDITERLLHHDGLFEDPQTPRNPFTNIPLTQSQTISIWNSVSRAGIPVSSAFTLFRNSRFLMNKFMEQNTTFLKLNSLRKTFKEARSYDYTDRLLDFIDYSYNAESIDCSINAFRNALTNYPNHHLIKKWAALCEKYYEPDILYAGNNPKIHLMKERVLDETYSLLHLQRELISLNTIVENIPHDPVIFGLMGSLDFLYDDN